MGEETITKEREVEEEKEVHVCDFCGRDSDEASGFEDILINPKNLETHGITTSQKGFAKHLYITKSTKTELTVGELQRHLPVDYQIDEKRHLCEECYNAFKGTVDSE